ncbi:MAG: AsmA-like C-terminal region-containing protein [Terracidiphilus sp.]|jgi:hypothetical protein
MGSDREAGLAENGARLRRGKRWLIWVAVGLLAALAVAAGIAAVLLHRAEPFVRARIVEELESRFHARVELDSFHMSLAHGLQAEGKGLRIWPAANHPKNEDLSLGTPANHPKNESATADLGSAGEAGQTGQGQQNSAAGAVVTDEPMIRLDEFHFRAPLHFVPGKPFHISLVELNGLDVHLPPRSHFDRAAAAGADTENMKEEHAGIGLVQFVVDKIICNRVRLVLATSKPGKLPLEFAIARVTLTGIQSGGAFHSQSEDRSMGAPMMAFGADLTNPRPVGAIHTTGKFGPWEGVDPGEIPITGDYRFEHADLASFKGIAGIMSSTGHYQGTLRDLTVDGTANVPDFRLTHFGSAMNLDTTFHAKVDGTNGDTWLEPVDATLGHSHFTAQGPIVRVVVAEAGEPPHGIGHDINLTVNVDRGRIEDFLQLASPPQRTVPLLTGAVTTKASLDIPPGKEPVHERLRLKGHFNLSQARFTSEKIQGRIEQLSLRGQGRPKDVKTTDADSVRSTMQGDFQIAEGVVTLPKLVYDVPGATIELNGTYVLEGGALDFTGSAKMEATVSQMVGGWAGALLKPADRFFRKDGAGTDIPIRIGGTRDEPSFGVEFGRKKESEAAQPEQPAEKP